MDEKQTLAAIIAACLLSGGIIGGFINMDKPIYQCDSKNTIANCFKLGAEGARCYYNETAPLKYSNCAEGWHILSKDTINPENSGTDGVLIKEFNKCSFVCYPEGCVKCQ